MYKHIYSIHLCVCVSTSIHAPTMQVCFSKLPILRHFGPWGCGAASNQFLDPRLESWMRRRGWLTQTLQRMNREWTWYPETNVAMENHNFWQDTSSNCCFSKVMLVFGFVIWRGVETVFTPKVRGHSKQVTPEWPYPPSKTARIICPPQNCFVFFFWV